MNFLRGTRVRIAVGVLVTGLLGGSYFAGVASGHDVGMAEYVYYTEAVAAPTYYRCAGGGNHLEYNYGPIFSWDAYTRSRYYGFCAGQYNVAAGNLGVATSLLWWNQGTPVTCLTAGGWNTSASWQIVGGALSTAGPPCGTGRTYSVTGAHTVYILGTPRSAVLVSGSHGT